MAILHHFEDFDYFVIQGYVRGMHMMRPSIPLGTLDSFFGRKYFTTGWLATSESRDLPRNESSGDGGS